MKNQLFCLLVLGLLLSACEKEQPSRGCLLQSAVETVIGHDGRPEYDNHIQSHRRFDYSYDGNDRLTQVRRTSLVSTEADFVGVDTYVYDGQGRIIAIKSETNYNPGDVTTRTFRYNPAGQVTVISRKHPNFVNIESWRTEYTYASAQELKSSKLFIDDQLHLTRTYTYTDGLMTSVTSYPKSNPTHVLEIRYDDKRSPLSASPELLAVTLDPNTEIDYGLEHDLGYPHRHNITGLSSRELDGAVTPYYNFSIDYTYSAEGYPLSSQQVFPQYGNSERRIEYSYTCH